MLKKLRAFLIASFLVSIPSINAFEIERDTTGFPELLFPFQEKFHKTVWAIR